jgi:hypothetical protein
MKTGDLRFNRGLSILVVGSFAVCALVVILRLGLGATPYTTVDSGGRTMGFNDPLSAEHFLIMVSNFDAADLLARKHAYEWLLVAAHVAGAGFLLMGPRISTRIVRWYFAGQTMVFPFGIPAILILPLMMFGFLTGRSVDREGFVDIPFIIAAAHPVWVLTSLYIVFALRGEGLGLGRVWSGVAGLWRSGAKVFVDAVR